MSDVIKETREKIDQLVKARGDSIIEAAVRVEEARADVVKAEKAMEAAMMNMDAPAYEKARTQREKAESRLEMYLKRQEQLDTLEYISEAESDAVIDSLLAYEKELEAAFSEKIAGPIAELREIYEEHSAKVKEAEDLIREWTASVHLNYRLPGVKYADGSRRSPAPVPVRLSPYFGGREAQLLAGYLEKEEEK